MRDLHTVANGLSGDGLPDSYLGWATYDADRDFFPSHDMECVLATLPRSSPVKIARTSISLTFLRTRHIVFLPLMLKISLKRIKSTAFTLHPPFSRNHRKKNRKRQSASSPLPGGSSVTPGLLAGKHTSWSQGELSSVGDPMRVTSVTPRLGGIPGGFAGGTWHSKV